MCSSKLCDTPSIEGTKSIAAGITLASGAASWIALDESVRQPPLPASPGDAAVAYFNGHAFFEDRAESEHMMAMLQEFIATGAHYDETLRAQFPLFRGAAPPGHPFPEAWCEGATFLGRGRRIGG